MVWRISGFEPRTASVTRFWNIGIITYGMGHFTIGVFMVNKYLASAKNKLIELKYWNIKIHRYIVRVCTEDPCIEELRNSGAQYIQSVLWRLLKAVLRIHDILVWIRIRIWIRGSMPLTNGSGCGSCYFRLWPSRCQQKTNFLKKFFCSLLFKVYLHHVSKLKRSHKAVRIKVFLTNFAWW